MHYPEGQKVTIGDIIWTNEGINIRRVVKIIESKDEIQSSGTNESGIFYSSDLSGICQDILGFESYADFVIEGIGLLSDDEWLLIRCLHKIWHLNSQKSKEKNPYSCVRYPIQIHDNTFEYRWFFNYYTEQNCSFYMLNNQSLDFIELNKNDYVKTINKQ